MEKFGLEKLEPIVIHKPQNFMPKYSNYSEKYHFTIAMVACDYSNNCSFSFVNNNTSLQAMNQLRTTSSNNVFNNITLTKHLLTYENHIFGVKMQYPSDWTKNNEINIDNFEINFTSPRQNTTDAIKRVQVVLVAYPVVTSHNVQLQLRDFVSLLVENNSKTYPAFNLTNSFPTTLAGNPAYGMEYARSDKYGDHLRFLEIYALKNGKIYEFELLSSVALFNRFLPIASEMMNSIQIGNITKKDNIEFSLPSHKITDIVSTYKNSDIGLTLVFAVFVKSMGITEQDNTSFFQLFSQRHIAMLRGSGSNVVAVPFSLIEGHPAYGAMYIDNASICSLLTNDDYF